LGALLFNLSVTPPRPPNCANAELAEKRRNNTAKKGRAFANDLDIKGISRGLIRTESYNKKR
jgi:hypothetical protein